MGIVLELLGKFNISLDLPSTILEKEFDSDFTNYHFFEDKEFFCRVHGVPVPKKCECHCFSNDTEELYIIPGEYEILRYVKHLPDNR